MNEPALTGAPIPDDTMQELVEIAPELSVLERKYIYWRSLGNPPKVAMTNAGYKSTANASQLDVRPKIRHALSKLSEELAPEFRVTRKIVMGMLFEAADIARRKDQAQNLITAAVEMARIQGVDAPQRFMIDSRTQAIPAPEKDSMKSLEHLSKAELEARAGIIRRLPSAIVDGEFEEILVTDG